MYAHASLAETLRTMSANLVDDAVDVIPLEGRRSDVGAILADDIMRGTIERVVTALILASRRPQQFSSSRRLRSGTVLYRSVG
jgi:hypothetical protein